MGLSDEELVGRCLAGEEEAFRTLVERYDQRVYATIYRLVRTEADARDLTQETFLRFFRSLDRFDRSRSLSAWILRIAANQTLDFLRRKRLQTVPLDAIDESDADLDLYRDPGPEDARLRERRRARLEAVVRRLAPGYQVVIELRHSHGLQMDEIAEVLDIPATTVRSRLHRAHRQLCAWLEGRDHVDL